jgi:hypothetical protein
MTSTNDSIKCLNGSDFETRIDAMSELRDRKDTSAVPALVQLLQNDRDHRIREEAAFSLEGIGDARAVEPLIVALMDLNADVRLKTARALGTFMASRAVEPLCTSLRDPDQVVRVFAAYALGKIGDRKAIEPLRAALQNSTHPEARQAIERVLKDFEKLPPPSDVTFSCPSCGQHIAIDEAYRGHQVQCPTCQVGITVPVSRPATPPPPPPVIIPQPPIPMARPARKNTWAQTKISMGVAALVLSLIGRIVFPLLGQAFGGLFMLLAFVCTFGGFILAIVSLFKKDGWVWGIIAIVASIFISLFLRL